jgi:hypothetical protein
MPKRKITRTRTKSPSVNHWPKLLSIVTVLVVIFLTYISAMRQKTDVFQVTGNTYPFGKAIKLNGSSVDPQYVSINHNSAQLLGETFTIEAWIKPELPPLNTPSTYTVFRKNIVGTTDSRLYSFTIQATYVDNDPRVNVQYIFSTLGSSCISNSTIQWNNAGMSVANFSKWKHIALVKQPGKMYLFENGIPLRTAGAISSAVTNCDTSAPLTIGAHLNNKTGVPQSFFKGLIDDFRISNTARYTANFPVAMAPALLDQSTRTLYKFDGSLLDSSTNLMNGNGTGNITYVDSDIVTIASPSATPTPSMTATPSVMPSGKPSPSPIPSGCYYQQVKCVRAPCNPILVCAPAPSPRIIRTPRPTPTPIPRCRKVFGRVVCWPNYRHN